MELPPNIGNLVNLQRLVLAGNRLASFPDSLRHLQALRVLDLNNNHLTSIPPISERHLPLSTPHPDVRIGL